jgi:hypothetical protein
VQKTRGEENVFPTFYRCNTVPAMRRALSRAGFENHVYGFESEPNYLGFSRITYALGVVYHRLTPNYFRNALFGFGRKPRAAK